MSEVRFQDAQAAPPGQRVPPGILTVVTLWRLAIAACAFVGFFANVNGRLENLAYLTQQSNLLTGLVFTALAAYPLFTGGRRHEPRTGWIRGAVTMVMTLVGVVYLTMMNGTYHTLGNLMTHLVVPIVVLLDWLVVGRNQAACRWWHPLSWLAFPLAYLVFYVANGEALYGFLNPDRSSFVGTVAVFLVAIAGLGYLLHGIGKVRGAIGGTAPAAVAQPFPGVPQAAPGQPPLPHAQAPVPGLPQPAPGRSMPQPGPSPWPARQPAPPYQATPGHAQPPVPGNTLPPVPGNAMPQPGPNQPR